MPETRLSTELHQGNQYLKSGHLKEAHMVAMQLISLYPKNISVLIFVSKVKYSLQQYGDAIAYVAEAIEQDNNRVELHIHLAECYATANQWAKAETTLDQVVNMAEGNFKNLNSAAVIYSLCELHEKSKNAIQKALEINPDSAKLLYNLGSLQRVLGNIDAAEKSIKRSIELDPDNTVAVYILSGLRRQTKQSNNISYIKSRLARTTNDLNADIQLNFSLAKEYEDLKEWDKSFEALTLGAKAKRKTFKYNSEQNIKILERTASLHSKDYLSKAVKSCTAESPVFILGLPRTGSTLVDTIISSHKDVVSAGELPDFPNQFILQLNKAAAQHPSMRRDKMALSLDIDFRELGKGYINAVTGKIGKHNRFTDKLPFNFQYCGMIKNALPNARIIHIRRDPMDSCYSIFKALFVSPYPYSYDLEELAEYYAAYYRLMDHWRDAMPGAILDVNYEDMITDHEKETRRIIDWCGLEWDPACLDYRNTDKAVTTLSAPQVRKEIYSSSIGKWRHFEKQMAPVKAYLEKVGIDIK